MKYVGLACLVSWLVMSAVAESQESIYVTHLEAPDYPRIARVANLQAKITITATINEDGKVIQATADELTSVAHKVLQEFALENIQNWTFTKPPHTPYTQVVVYDYRLDSSKPASYCPTTALSFDMPGHVAIVGGVLQVDGYVTKPGKPK
jgi:TonB family protein